MNAAAPLQVETYPPIVALERLSPLDADAVDRLSIACRSAERVRSRTELIREGDTSQRSFLLLDGWAASVRILHDGQRQLLALHIAGDRIGSDDRSCAAPAALVAITDLLVCRAPIAALGSALAAAYREAAALHEVHLLAQITRLGRMTAEDRIADLFIELNRRFSASGLDSERGLPLPLTQEIIADAVGLTPVHVNRMLRLMRETNRMDWRNGFVSFPPSRKATPSATS